MVERLNDLTGGEANAALRRTDVIVPEEPVAVVDLGVGPGWLGVARAACGGHGGATAAFAVLLPDDGRPDPLRGRRALDALGSSEAEELRTVTLPASVHARLVSVLTEFSYQHLRELGGGQMPRLPSLRLALAVRCP